MSDPSATHAAVPPSVAYAAGVARGEWSDDPAQHPVLVELDRIHSAVAHGQAKTGWIGKLLGRDEADFVPGLYLWGGVGRGKTFLIDLFFDGLPLRDFKADGLSIVPLPHGGRGRGRSRTEGGNEGNGKRRTHFHRFMRAVHEQLRAHSGERDPLSVIAHEWRKTLRVLVLDEFFVSDIGDAMLLGRLLDRLFAEGVVLVTSSNAAPSTLYADGLQRARFEPAIALIEQRCRVVELVSDTDYRLRALTRSPVYRAPLDAESDVWLASRWQEIGAGAALRPGTIELEGRKIAVRSRTKGTVWFDFAALCEGPRGSNDYIEIAREFHTVMLGGIPVMDALHDDAARRFVTLVDELYDRHVNLVCTAASPPQDLYAGERVTGAFERCASRLIEMRSAEYLAQAHRN